ncbi:sucrose-phosphatase-related family protein [Striga asiatica]|uniref:Sucrose-phosphatase-related family protein n=1 Tax=Striga asiatica TaxID=4170 RepID=A0A5A7QCJ9_STRAF|nr:sucrose-phosphatase-related family protein [Striga asiatica]
MRNQQIDLSSQRRIWGNRPIRENSITWEPIRTRHVTTIFICPTVTCPYTSPLESKAQHKCLATVHLSVAQLFPNNLPVAVCLLARRGLRRDSISGKDELEARSFLLLVFCWSYSNLPLKTLTYLCALACTCRRITSLKIASRPTGISLDHSLRQINCCFQAQGIESSNRYVHSSAILDDDFSELGPEVSEHCANRIQLFTVKKDCVTKTYKQKRKPDGRPIPSHVRSSAKEIVASMGRNFSRSNSEVGDHSHSSMSTNNTVKVTDVESPCSVLVKNIVPSVGLSELVEAISVFGKVSGASFTVASDGNRSCNIEFEDEESSRKAISAGKIGVGSREFPVHHPLGDVQIVTFRIEKINIKTTDYVIHSRCKVMSEFMGLARASDGAVDAFFNVRNDSIQHSILQMLNSTVIDLSRWSAHIVKSKSAEPKTISDNEARHNLGMQIMNHLSELGSQLQMKKIVQEDLEALYAGIMHIEDSPQAVD